MRRRSTSAIVASAIVASAWSSSSLCDARGHEMSPPQTNAPPMTISPTPRVVICYAKSYSNPVLYWRHLAASLPARSAHRAWPPLPAAAILTSSKRLGMLTATVLSGGTASVDPSTHTIRLRRYGWIARKLVPPRWNRNGGEARGYAWTNDDMMRAVVMRRCSIGRNAQSHQQSQD